MHREGMNPKNVQPEDILCDFCMRAAYANNEPCVEGHHGSIVCGICLAQAYTALVINKTVIESDKPCVMCLEKRDGPVWFGEVNAQAHICKRCTKQSAGVLNKSKHWDWSKPTSA